MNLNPRTVTTKKEKLFVFALSLANNLSDISGPTRVIKVLDTISCKIIDTYPPPIPVEVKIHGGFSQYIFKTNIYKQVTSLTKASFSLQACLPQLSEGR